MLLSNILKNMNFEYCTHVINEQPFKYLALTESKISEDCCVFLDNEKFINTISDNVKMVLTTSEISNLLSSKKYGYCITDSPRELFFILHNYLSESETYKRNTFKTMIGDECSISKQASIAENNVKIGNNVTIEEFVVIRENTIIGDNTIIRAGSVIGGQGFEFKRTDKNILSVQHLGGVKIGNNAEIQYNTCVDKAVYPWDDTEIGDYTKIDNLVHIGHAVKIKSNVMIVANVGIGGRTCIGDNTWIGFASTVINGIDVGENARVNIGAVVTRSVPNGSSVTGNFAIEHSKFIRNLKKANED